MCNTMLLAQKAQRLHRGNILLTMPHRWHGRRKFHKWCPRETRTYVSAKKRSQKHHKSQTWKTQKHSWRTQKDVWTIQKHPWTKQKSHEWPKHHDDHIEASDDEYVYVKEEVADEPSREHVKQKVTAQSSSSQPDPPRPSAKLASRKQSMVKVQAEHMKQKVMAQSSSSRPDPPRASAKLASKKQSMVKVKVEHMKQKVTAQSSSSRPHPPSRAKARGIPADRLPSPPDYLPPNFSPLEVPQYVPPPLPPPSEPPPADPPLVLPRDRPQQPQDPPRPSAKLASTKQSMVKVEQPEQPEKKPVPLLISPGRPQSVPVNVGIWPPRPVIRRPPDRQFKWPQSVRGASDSQPVIRRPQERPESVRVIVGIWPAPRKPAVFLFLCIIKCEHEIHACNCEAKAGQVVAGPVELELEL
eukprot:symbB.v1.2.035661.t1/scaffold4860.1/size33793/3